MLVPHEQAVVPPKHNLHLAVSDAVPGEPTAWPLGHSAMIGLNGWWAALQMARWQRLTQPRSKQQCRRQLCRVGAWTTPS